MALVQTFTFKDLSLAHLCLPLPPPRLSDAPSFLPRTLDRTRSRFLSSGTSFYLSSLRYDVHPPLGLLEHPLRTNVYRPFFLFHSRKKIHSTLSVYSLRELRPKTLLKMFFKSYNPLIVNTKICEGFSSAYFRSLHFRTKILTEREREREPRFRAISTFHSVFTFDFYIASRFTSRPLPLLEALESKIFLSKGFTFPMHPLHVSQ